MARCIALVQENVNSDVRTGIGATCPDCRWFLMDSTLFLLDVDAVVLVGYQNDLQILMGSVSRETD